MDRDADKASDAPRGLVIVAMTLASWSLVIVGGQAIIALIGFVFA